MLNPLRHSSLRSFHDGLMRLVVLAGIVLAALLLMPSLPVAQQKPLHLNPVIAKLAEGKTVYGLNTGDLSLVYAREVARVDERQITSVEDRKSTRLNSSH